MKSIAIFNEDNDWIKAYRAVNTLLNYGVNILWAQESIEDDEKTFRPGAFLISLESILSNWNKAETLQSYKNLGEEEITKFLKNEGVKIKKVDIIQSINTIKLEPAAVALYQDSGCFSHAFVVSTSGFDVNWVTGVEIAVGILESYDIFMSGGGGGAKKANINRENLLLASMGVDGAKNVTKFVSEGGAYFGCCGGSYIASVVRERFMNWWHPAKKHMTMMNVEDWHINEYSDSGFKSPGQGTYIAQNIAQDNPTMFGIPEFFECVHWNGPMWNLIEAAVEKASSPKALTTFKEVSTKRFTPSEFYKTNITPSEVELKDTGFYKGCELGKTAIAQGHYGNGLVFLSASHPEMNIDYGSELSKDSLWDSTRILCNATLLASSNNNREKKKIKIKNNFVIPFKSYQKDYVDKINTIKEKVKSLTEYNQENNERWLDPKLYSLSYGLTPREMYIKNLEELPELCDKIISELKEIDELIQKAVNVIDKIKTRRVEINNPEIKALNILEERGISTIIRYFNMIGKQKEPIWDRDKNQSFQGVYDLINSASEKADNSLKSIDQNFTNKVKEKELLENPFVNINSSRTSLDNALKILWVNEDAVEKFIKLWTLYDM